MSRRTDKKKFKKQLQAASGQNASTTAGTGQEPVINFYIQYQNTEYLSRDIIHMIRQKCLADETEDIVEKEINIYLKPEDKKAYYTYRDVKGSIDL